MNFLEASSVASAFEGGPSMPLLLAMSGTADPLEVFLRASAAKKGFSLSCKTMPYGTFQQNLFAEPQKGECEIILLTPWDLVPQADWRSGLPAMDIDEQKMYEFANNTMDRVTRRNPSALFYLSVPIPPLFSDTRKNGALEGFLLGLAQAANAIIYGGEYFAMSSYLANGCPLANNKLGDVADDFIEAISGHPRPPSKVLITDADNVLWQGLVAEDGLEALDCRPQGSGYRHFLFQTMLQRLKKDGALVAVVSRNTLDDVNAALSSEEMLMKPGDFVSVMASYEAKSAQIQLLSEKLNLGLDSFVFVDDNPVEIAEVSLQLPEVQCIQFPIRDDHVPEMFSRLAQLFSRKGKTAEDTNRTELYKKRLKGVAPANLDGADLTDFLTGMKMTLNIHDRTHGPQDRAVQLINKTNQFNLNGRRMTGKEVKDIATSGRLLSGSLKDTAGAHGEIIACLISGENVVEALVMSCRVFQRRVEYAFLAWLVTQDQSPLYFRYAETQRNEPFRRFLDDPAFTFESSGCVTFDARNFISDHSADLDIIQILSPVA